MKLSDDQVNSFKELGYVFIENVFNSEEVKRFADSPPDIDGSEHDEILQLNRQIRKNEGLRRGQVQEISG